VEDRRTERAVTLGVIVAAAAIGLALVTLGPDHGAPAAVAVASRPVPTDTTAEPTTAAVTTAAPTTTTSAPSDPGALPQTDDRPAASGATFNAGVQALWQAIESYAAGTKTKARLFSKSELKKLRQALPEDFSAAQDAALQRIIGRLNEEPLRARLRRRLKSDAVPVTDAELKVLDDLREVRNAVAHGRDIDETIDRDTVNYGISIVARILVHRIAASADELEKEA